MGFLIFMVLFILDDAAGQEFYEIIFPAVHPQRVAIARALAMQHGTMLFDELTSAPDPEMIQEVLDVMRNPVRDGMTMVVVTHEMGSAGEAAHSIVLMADGRIIEKKCSDDFFTRPENEGTRLFLSKILSY